MLRSHKPQWPSLHSEYCWKVLNRWVHIVYTCGVGVAEYRMFFVVEYLIESTIKGLGKYLRWPNFPKLFILRIV